MTRPAPKKRTPTGRTGPAKMKVYSIETYNGHSALARAKSMDEILDALRAGTDFVLFTRVDGEPLVIAPQHVFLVGEVST